MHLRRVAERDRMPPRRVVLSESKASRRIAAKGCTVQCIDIDGWQGGQCGRPRLEADTTGEP